MPAHLTLTRCLLLGAGAWVCVGPAAAEIRRDLPLAQVQKVSSGTMISSHGPKWNDREEWAALPPEQRQQMRQQMREHWQQMPPEQREAARNERREQWQRMSQEQRDALRQERWEHWQQMPREDRQRIRQELHEQRGENARGGRQGGRH